MNNESKKDLRSIRIETEKGDLICSFSSVRYRKGKYEMEKQIEKAKQVMEKPSKTKRLKFTQTEDTKVSINEALIEKTTKLLGIKGYYTNLKSTIADDATIIEHYHLLTYKMIFSI